MQGLKSFVPTEKKIEYINQLLRVGFHTLDCGSFVSPKAIPQMRDTDAVLSALDLSESQTKLSVIVANKKGIELAKDKKTVTYLGYPFSVSEEFQRRNTNKSMTESLDIVKFLVDECSKQGKESVVYISMGFGNPYDEEWNATIVEDWVGKISEIGVNSFSISDTVGVSTPDDISEVFKRLLISFPDNEFGAHFHTRPDQWLEKVDSAWRNGCKRFDGAIKGYGGCPMAKDDLVGNMATENLISYFRNHHIEHGLNYEEFNAAQIIAASIFD